VDHVVTHYQGRDLGSDGTGNRIDFDAGGVSVELNWQHGDGILGRSGNRVAKGILIRI
jgi:hypothetical protein